MKKITFKIFIVCVLFTSFISSGQCLTSVNGLYPAATFTPTCSTVNPNVITTVAYAGEYSNVNVVSGETYTFASSNPTDYITISTDGGTTASAYGITPITWTSDVDGVIRYYIHLDDLCGEADVSRTRTIACGTPLCIQPQVAFSKIFDCGSSTFEVTADITDLGSASTITVTDNQASSPQSVSSTGPVTFGPYAFGTSVILTATNDDTPVCNVVSPAQVFVSCPPANDECYGAEPLTINADGTCTVVTSSTIAGATASSVDAASCFGSEDDDVWFSFVAENGSQTITLNNVVGSTTDLAHSLWTGDCGSLTLVAGTCSDPNFSAPSGLIVGQTYYLRVFSYTTAFGQTTTFDVCIGTPPPPPANDDCAGAIEIFAGGTFTTSPIIGSNVSSTSTAGLPTFLCQTNRSNDVWYSVTVPDSGSLTIETQAAPGTLMTDTVISMYTGTCGALVEVGCDDDSGTDNFSLSTVAGLTPGSTLYIGVWKWGTSLDGDFQLAAYDASLLGNSSFESDGFKSYPNPLKNVMNLSYSKNISSITVLNLLGQEVLTKAINANQSQIDMSHLSTGTYLVKVTADDQVKTIKVIKE